VTFAQPFESIGVRGGDTPISSTYGRPTPPAALACADKRDGAMVSCTVCGDGLHRHARPISATCAFNQAQMSRDGWPAGRRGSIPSRLCMRVVMVRCPRPAPACRMPIDSFEPPTLGQCHEAVSRQVTWPAFVHRRPLSDRRVNATAGSPLFSGDRERDPLYRDSEVCGFAGDAITAAVPA